MVLKKSWASPFNSFRPRTSKDPRLVQSARNSRNLGGDRESVADCGGTPSAKLVVFNRWLHVSNPDFRMLTEASKPCQNCRTIASSDRAHRRGKCNAQRLWLEDQALARGQPQNPHTSLGSEAVKRHLLLVM